MQFLYYALFAAGIVAVDQLSKYFTVAYIPLYTDISFIPGVLNLTYVQNSGAAFSSFEGQQWLFALGVFQKEDGLYALRALVHCGDLRRRPCQYG